MIKIRKYILPFILGLLFLTSNINAQWRIPADSVFQLIKTHSIYKNALNWGSIDVNYENCLKAASDNPSIVNCLANVFDQLNDISSSLIYKNHVYSNSQAITRDSMQVSASLIEQSNRAQGKIKTGLFKDKYAYILIPGIQVADDQINTYAQAISDSINKYSNSNTKGFIVDLRLNTGGQLASMLSGLHSLLGNENVGGEIDENQKMLKSWKIESGNFIQQGIPMTSIKESSSASNQLPVAVLIGPMTQGTGNMVAIAFKYRPNTFFIGESGADGSTIAKSKFKISDELVLDLATAYVVDRKRHIYNHYIPMDIQVQGGDDFENLTTDYKVRAAIKWLDRKFSKNLPGKSK